MGSARHRDALVHKHDRRRDDQCRDLLPHRRRHSADHERAGGFRAVLFFERLANRLQRGGPARRFHKPRRRAEPLQALAVLCMRRDKDFLDQARMTRVHHPALVPCVESRGQILVLGRRFQLECDVGARQLPVELLRECGGMRAEIGRHALALRIADLAQPAVLQRREHRDQAEQSGRHDEQRQPETGPHRPSLAPRAGRKALCPQGFTCLTIS